MSSSATRLGPIIQRSSVANPRVEDSVQDVREQVSRDDEQRGKERHAHHGRVVVLERSLERELADAGPPENYLDDKAAAHQAGQLEADQRDERDERVAQSVQVDDPSLAHALGASRAD